MSSESDTSVPLNWLAGAVLAFSVGLPTMVLGVVFKMMKYPKWDLLLELGFMGTALGALLGIGMGVVWAVRVLFRDESRGY